MSLPAGWTEYETENGEVSSLWEDSAGPSGYSMCGPLQLMLYFHLDNANVSIPALFDGDVHFRLLLLLLIALLSQFCNKRNNMG